MLTAVVMLMTACASIGKIENQPLQQVPDTPHGYSLEKHAESHERGETELVLAFSGGGTRAAALSYGVLKELRDTTIYRKGQNQRMLDEVRSNQLCLGRQLYCSLLRALWRSDFRGL